MDFDQAVALLQRIEVRLGSITKEGGFEWPGKEISA